MGEILRNLHIQLVKIGVQLNYYTAYSGKIEICMILWLRKTKEVINRWV